MVKQIKTGVSLDLKEWYQGDDIQKLMKIGTLLDPQFKKVLHLTEVERTATGYRHGMNLLPLSRLTKIGISRGISIFS